MLNITGCSNITGCRGSHFLYLLAVLDMDSELSTGGYILVLKGARGLKASRFQERLTARQQKPCSTPDMSQKPREAKNKQWVKSLGSRSAPQLTPGMSDSLVLTKQPSMSSQRTPASPAGCNSCPAWASNQFMWTPEVPSRIPASKNYRKKKPPWPHHDRNRAPLHRSPRL